VSLTFGNCWVLGLPSMSSVELDQAQGLVDLSGSQKGKLGWSSVQLHLGRFFSARPTVNQGVRWDVSVYVYLQSFGLMDMVQTSGPMGVSHSVWMAFHPTKVRPAVVGYIHYVDFQPDGHHSRVWVRWASFFSDSCFYFCTGSVVRTPYF
jgi:hypothetical protein